MLKKFLVSTTKIKLPEINSKLSDYRDRSIYEIIN